MKPFDLEDILWWVLIGLMCATLIISMVSAINSRKKCRELDETPIIIPYYIGNIMYPIPHKIYSCKEWEEEKSEEKEF